MTGSRNMEDRGFRVGGQEDFGGATARGVEKEEDRRSFSFAGDITDLTKSEILISLDLYSLLFLAMNYMIRSGQVRYID